MRLKYVAIVFAILALSASALACGGDDDGGGNGGQQTEAPADGDNDDRPAATTEAPDGSDGDGDDGANNGDGDGDDGANNGDGDGDDGANGGDGDGDDGANGGDGDGDDGGSDGAGEATLTIGAMTWSFDDVSCAFSPEETQSERVSFRLIAFGETEDGLPIRVIADIGDPQLLGRYDGEDVVKSVEMEDIESFAADPTLHWWTIEVPARDLETIFLIDDPNVTVDASFDDRTTASIEMEPGSLVATCP